jgi:hypothetical protein
MTDLDPLLRETMAAVRGPVGARPSLSDVRHRARRRNRRRMSVTAGVVACAGVATTALIIRRDTAGSSAAGDSVAADSPTASTLYTPNGSTTTSVYGLSTITITPATVWEALGSASSDPAGAALQIVPANQADPNAMPTPEQFGCASAQCRAMYTYVVWHEIAKAMGFSDVIELQAVNPNIDFSVPPVEGAVLQTFNPNDITATTSNFNDTTTTFAIFQGILLVDAGAPAGAMDDAMQRLFSFNPTIVAGTGKSVEQTMIMPIDGNRSMAAAVGGLLGVDGFDTWDPSFVADPISGTVAVVIGPDYWDRVHIAFPGATTTTTPATTTTSIG